MNDEARDDVVDALQTQVDVLDGQVVALSAELEEANTRNQALAEQLENAQNALAQPVGDSELRALANTVVTARRNGHPDWTVHLDALLKTLGAL